MSAVALVLLLCNTLVVFANGPESSSDVTAATESSGNDLESSSDAAAATELSGNGPESSSDVTAATESSGNGPESSSGVTAATELSGNDPKVSSDAAGSSTDKPESLSDAAETSTDAAESNLPDGTETPLTEMLSACGTDTAATQEELLAWLEEHQSSEGTLKLTADISLGTLSYQRRLSAAPATIDTGEYSLTAAGDVELYGCGLTIRGKGGERGVLRAKAGGRLMIGYMSVVSDEGFAVFQEEGAGFVAEECVLDDSDIHYAKTPFVWSLESAFALAEPGQTAADVLPDTIRVRMNKFGKLTYEETSVSWKLAGHESAERLRSRFTVTGEVENLPSFDIPVCTVAYNDYPLTFTEITATQSRYYKITGGFTVLEEWLPITIAVEYSFDEDKWLIQEMQDIPDARTAFVFLLQKNDKENGWDTAINPWLYLRLHWEDGGTHYYSNVLRFSGENFGKAEDRGGNRGGGTDIVDPPEIPEPGSTPENDSEPGSTPENDPEPDLTPKPAESLEPEPEEDTVQGTMEPSEMVMAKEPVSVKSSPSVREKKAIQGTSQSGQETQEEVPEPESAEDGLSGQAAPAPADLTGEAPADEAVQKPDGEADSMSAGTVPIVAGCTTIGMLIGAAGIYHSPILRKRIWEVLKKILRIRK